MLKRQELLERGKKKGDYHKGPLNLLGGKTPFVQRRDRLRAFMCSGGGKRGRAMRHQSFVRIQLEVTIPLNRGTFRNELKR